MPSIAPQLGLTNLQVELLKLYARPIANEDLEAIKRLIARYFAEKAMDEADQIWQERNYNADDILNTHLRTPYKPAQ